MTVKNVVHGVDERNAGDEKKNADPQRCLRRGAQLPDDGRGGNQGSHKGRNNEDDLMVETERRQLLANIESGKRRDKDKEHGDGVALKQAAESRVGAGHQQAQAQGRHRGQRQDAFKIAPGFREGKVFVNDAPAQGIERGNAAENEGAAAKDGDLFYCISKGLDRARDITRGLLREHDGLAVIDGWLIPALNRVGEDYAAGRIFLPQLISSAETAKLCFDEVRSTLADASSAEKGVIVLATVKGDVHDIGKNIVKTVLENYGYRVIDLGKNVPPEEVAAACEKYAVKLCGLSALMTTTVDNMRITVGEVKRRCPSCKVMVGGAVLTAEYAEKIGADKYCRDAAASARYAGEIFGAGK